MQTRRARTSKAAARIRRARRVAGLTFLVLTLVLTLLLAVPLPATAHGGATGVAEVWQDYGALIILVAVVLIGAGVLAWAAWSPANHDDEDEDEEEARPA